MKCDKLVCIGNLVFPVLTTVQRTSIINPQAGRTCYDSDLGQAFIGDGAAWQSIGSGGGAATFLDLTDSPASYAGSATKFVGVNASENALIFYDGETEGNIDGGDFGANTQYTFTNDISGGTY